MLAEAPLAQLTFADLALVALLTLALPVYVLIEHLNDRRRKREGLPRPLLKRYRHTMLMLWGLTLLTLALWLSAGRSLAALGLTAPQTWPFAACMLTAIVLSTAYAMQIVSVRRSEKARADVLAMLRKQEVLGDILPKTQAEMQSFRLVALTAGITEEVLFRGFLLWAFAHWAPLWAAAAMSLAVFTLAHLYQESARAIAGVFIAGAVMTALAVLSGSLLPAMLVHVVVDLAGGEMVWAARRQEREKT
ncbi:MAG: CPBP family intramembrane glutamic endopeptidase [Hyphomonadaceae bacterium]